MTIQLKGETAEALNGGMQTGNAIELPYFTPKLWVVNGDARLRPAGGAQYFGGFCVSVEEWQKACTDWGYEQFILPGFVQTIQDTSDGKQIDVMMGRSVLVAPIGNRTTWFTGDGQRFSAYVPGTRQHAQIIALLAQKHDDGTIEPLGPVMLTAKGYQAKYMLDAFGAWDRETRMVRGKIAPGVPAWCFYLAIGTFGSERKQQMVGKGDKAKPVTPITAYVPNEITADLMERLFVGQECAEEMATYLAGAQEWLHAYDENKEAQSMVAAAVQMGGRVIYADNEYPDPIPPQDDIPF